MSCIGACHVDQRKRSCGLHLTRRTAPKGSVLLVQPRIPGCLWHSSKDPHIGCKVHLAAGQSRLKKWTPFGRYQLSSRLWRVLQQMFDRSQPCQTKSNTFALFCQRASITNQGTRKVRRGRQTSMKLCASMQWILKFESSGPENPPQGANLNYSAHGFVKT